MKKKEKKYTLREYIKYLKENPKGLWFKRRLYGWGWVPVTWQGWIVVLAFLVLVILNGVLLASNVPENGIASSWDLALFFFILVVLIVLLLWICYKKGEKPRWSWGR